MTYILYHYTPSGSGNMYFFIFFLVLLSESIILYWNYRKYQKFFKPEIPLLAGILMNAIGFLIRFLSRNKTQTVSTYAIQALLILLSPVVISFSIYMIFGRLVKLLKADRYCLISSKNFTKIFVISDIITFWVQCGGSGLETSASLAKYGKWIVVVGLAGQLLSFGFFLTIVIIFTKRMWWAPTHVANKGLIQKSKFFGWKHGLIALFLSSVAIMIRTVYRLIEFSLGNDSYLVRKESYFFYLDAAMIQLAVCFLISANFSGFFSSLEAEKMSDLELGAIADERQLI